jgi:hypothetical protein
MRRFSVLFVVLSVLMVMFAPAALAAPPRGVEITVDVDIANVSGPFTATGPAVGPGLLCPAGTAEGFVGDVREGTWFSTFTVDYTFTCENGVDAAVLRLNVWLHRSTGRTFALWRATGGEGAYVGLRGGGWLVGTPYGTNQIEDVYHGWLRF